MAQEGAGRGRLVAHARRMRRKIELGNPPPQHINVSKEDPDQTADRLIKFLKIVKYKPPSSLDP
jgi:hypothetical protein